MRVRSASSFRTSTCSLACSGCWIYRGYVGSEVRECCASDGIGRRRQATSRMEWQADRRYKKICLTDPDATMATNARNRRPSFRKSTLRRRECSEDGDCRPRLCLREGLWWAGVTRCRPTSLLCSRSSGECVIVRLPGSLRSSSSSMRLHRAGDGAVDDG